MGVEKRRGRRTVAAQKQGYKILGFNSVLFPFCWLWISTFLTSTLVSENQVGPLRSPSLALNPLFLCSGSQIEL